mgnify:CR=1 FL=1
MTSKEQQKQLLTDIMEADAKDGLYDQQSPMQSLLVHLEMLKSKVDTIDIQSLISFLKEILNFFQILLGVIGDLCVDGSVNPYPIREKS